MSTEFKSTGKAYLDIVMLAEANGWAAVWMVAGMPIRGRKRVGDMKFSTLTALAKANSWELVYRKVEDPKSE